MTQRALRPENSLALGTWKRLLVDLHVAMLVQCLFAHKIFLAVAAVEFRRFSARFFLLILGVEMGFRILVLLHALLVTKENFTWYAIAVSVCNLMLLEMTSVAERLLTVITPYRLCGRLVLLQSAIMDKVFTALVAMTALRGVEHGTTGRS